MSDYTTVNMLDGTVLYCIPEADLKKVQMFEELLSQRDDLKESLASVTKSRDDLKVALEGVRSMAGAYNDGLASIVGELSEALSIGSVNIGTYIDASLSSLSDPDVYPVEPGDDESVVWKVEVGENIQDRIDAAKSGDIIEIAAGIHRGTMDLSGKSDLTIRGAKDSHVEIRNMREVPAHDITNIRTTTGVVLAFDMDLQKLGLWHWRSDHPSAAFNSDLMFPLLLTVNERNLMYVPGAGVESLSHGEFTFSDPGTVYLKVFGDIADDESLHVEYADVPRIVWGDRRTENIHMENITFRGCSNTGKTGAISTPGKGWSLKDIMVDNVRTIGIELGQGGERSEMRSQVLDSTFINVTSNRAGQQGWWGSAKNCLFSFCGHYRSNWAGFDHWWEASCKFENTHNCRFVGWVARYCKGPGMWFDGVNGGNSNCVIDAPQIGDCERAGIELELNTDGFEIINPTIYRIADYSAHPQKQWGVSAGIVLKAGSDNNIIVSGIISDTKEGIRLKNDDTRGQCIGNTLEDTRFTNVSNPISVHGDVLDNKFIGYSNE